MLGACAAPGCQRLTHLRYCPDHVDGEQRDLRELLDRMLLDRDLALDRYRELGEAVAAIERRLGIVRGDR